MNDLPRISPCVFKRSQISARIKWRLEIMILYLPIFMAELYEALQQMSHKKALGQDGFPTEFYKECCTTISPTFYRMVIQSRESQTFSPNMNSANIRLFFTPCKDHTLPSNCHLISLINTDSNIICKAFAKILEKMAPCTIYLNLIYWEKTFIQRYTQAS